MGKNQTNTPPPKKKTPPKTNILYKDWINYKAIVYFIIPESGFLIVHKKTCSKN